MLVIAISLLPALPPSLSYLSVLSFLLFLFLLCIVEHTTHAGWNTLHLQTDFLNLCFVVSVRGFERVLSFLLCVEG